MDRTDELNESEQGIPILDEDENDDNRSNENEMAADDVKEAEPDNSIVESSEDTQDMNANDEYLESSKVDVCKYDDEKNRMEDYEITSQLESTKTKKFFTMIIKSEEGSDVYDDDDIGVEDDEYIYFQCHLEWS